MLVRRSEDGDLPFLQAMLLHTFFWRPDVPPRSLDEVLADPNLAKYIKGWGRAGDAGVVVTSDVGECLGAAWYRLFDRDDHSYGFVSPEIPELGIATVEAHRGRGLGKELLEGLVQVARQEGRPALSLSVEVDNVRALRLYEHFGFHRVERVGHSWTMLLKLKSPAVSDSSEAAVTGV